ncbi:MAG: HD domain-containing protein [Polyangiaceae bacterium]
MSSAIVEAARELAARAHADQVRKSGGLPYFSHLEAVAELVRLHGHDQPEVVAAAYLHDLLEDRPAFEAEFRDSMPPEVIATVEALSEVKLDAQGRRLPKAVRFERYLHGLSVRTEATERALPISCADKIHNTQSLVDAEARGEPLLLRLNTRPGEQLSHMARLRRLYEGVVCTSLLAEFDRVRAELERTVSRWLFGRAVMIAAEAHLGQFDRGGEPYILHPLQLALRAATIDERTVAVLHDVVEDSSVTLEQLTREGFPERVVRAVDALTKREGEDYTAFIERVARDRLATRVKLLDLEHNSDLSRLPSSPTAADTARVHKYAQASARLQQELARRSLQIALDADSSERARASAKLPVVRAEHVTLARRVDPNTPLKQLLGVDISPTEAISLRAVGECCDGRIQAWLVTLGGSSVRPWDSGVLHLTVSRTEGVRSKDSNELVSSMAPTPLEVELTGRLQWVDD